MICPQSNPKTKKTIELETLEIRAVVSAMQLILVCLISGKANRIHAGESSIILL